MPGIPTQCLAFHDVQAGEPWSHRDQDPDEWTTGGELMTGAQTSYLETLSEEAGDPFDPSLTKAEASRRIDELQARASRATSRDPRASAPCAGSAASASTAAARRR